MQLSRRNLCLHLPIGFAASVAFRTSPGLAAEDLNRKLTFVVRDEFNSSVANIEALLSSAANEIWRHCPQTKFTANGFTIYRNTKFPITHYKQEENRIVIGLNTEKQFWAQYSFQFAHEFCHALIDHTREEQLTWKVSKHANHWLDEVLCETASLFVLRGMSKTWQTAPPYPNWKSFADKLANYAEQRIDMGKKLLPAETTFSKWFLQERASLQEQSTQREKNLLIAIQLLPLFEAEPAGWESLTAIKSGPFEKDRPFATHLHLWQENVSPPLKPFVEKIARTFPAT